MSEYVEVGNQMYRLHNAVDRAKCPRPVHCVNPRNGKFKTCRSCGNVCGFRR